MMFPPVTVMIITYNRPNEIRQTIAALHSRIRYVGDVHWHIADDGSPGDYVNQIVSDFPSLPMTFTKTRRRGWGANANAALAAIPGQYLFVCEDDYVAMSDVDLTSGVALMQEQSHIGLVRYDGIEGHKLTVQLNTHSSSTAYVQYGIVLPESADLYMYSNRPHLVHRRFHDYYGIYPEGLPLGRTEETYAHMVKDHEEKFYKIAVLSTGIPRAFNHIGVSYQLTEEDVAVPKGK